MAQLHHYVMFLFGGILCGLTRGSPELSVLEQDMRILVNSRATVEIFLSEYVEASIYLSVNHEDLIDLSTKNITIERDITHYNATIFGKEAGHAELTISVNNSEINISTYARITIEKDTAIYHTSVVIGWIYFVAWSISFYPQIYENWKRKSVVGLNFDFLSLNIVGFILYSLFNCGLFWIKDVEDEYFSRYPRGLNPVQVNDIVFSLHAVIATLFTIIQCFIYERGNQTVSWTARAIHGIFVLVLVISLILVPTEVIVWLDFLYICSYVKLTITLIKYVPQAYMNYKRKSTEGWSIGNIFLDFTGGMLSMLQMILNAYNYNDWDSIFGDPTKFGLGLFSVVFDLFFIVQHYILYRNPKEIDLIHRV
ncbi:cystinosin homolog isoform X2 [Periplaneta americana]|uniref:cystinosin homolog isoform X2 n=1 Tax=Periplaneta americana TaxID=6978 RepID=UPI0037E8F9C8